MTAKTAETTLELLKPGSLKVIASVTADPCVSILMRTHRSGRETQQGPIRLKNLLKEASEQLEKAGHDDSILEPIKLKSNEHDFWQHQGDGLAIYLSPDRCRMFRLNRLVDEKVSVADSFFIQPLVREQNSTGSFFVLSLSWDEAKLFRSAGESLELVETAALPAKFDDLVLPSDPEESLQNTSHRSLGNTGGSSTAMFHGQGEGEDKIEADRDQYLSLIGDEVAGAIYNTGMPLVVVSTSEVSGHFEATTNVSIAAKVDGSPSQLSDDEIRDRAMEAIAPQLNADYSELNERFGTAMANSQASSDLDEVLTAAKNGRIASLMVCNNNEHGEQTNQAVVETLRTGGDVFLCSNEAMPSDDAVVAAIFRF